MNKRGLKKIIIEELNDSLKITEINRAAISMVRKRSGSDGGGTGDGGDSFFDDAKGAFKHPFGIGEKNTGPKGYEHVPYYFARILPIIAKEKLIPEIDPDEKLTDEQKEEFVKDFVGSFIKEEGVGKEKRWLWTIDVSLDLIHSLKHEIENGGVFSQKGETYEEQAIRREPEYTKPEIIEHTYKVLKRLFPNKMDPKGFKGKAARFLGKLGIGENKSKSNSINDELLRKIIKEELKIILQEDLGAGSKQSYEVPITYTVAQMLQRIIDDKEMLGDSKNTWAGSGCGYFVRENLNRAVMQIRQIIVLLQENK